MSSANRYLPKYTVADYQQWQGDWELWQGIAVAMTPSPFGRHQQVSTKLAVALQNSIDAVAYQAVVLAEMDWIVAADTVVRPDVQVLCGPVPQRHVETPPAVVAEVLSPSTRQRDLSVKLDLYAEQRVPYYLILDPEANTLLAHRLNADARYQPIKFENELSLEICDTCQLRIAADYAFG